MATEPEQQSAAPPQKADVQPETPSGARALEGAIARAAAQRGLGEALAQAGPDDRAHLVRALARTHGNASLQRLAAASRAPGPALQRSDTATVPLLTVKANEFVEIFASDIQTGLALAMTSVDLPLGTAFAGWRGGSSAFVTQAMRPICTASSKDLWGMLEKTLSPRGLQTIIDRGRDADEWGEGPRVYNPRVVTELRAAYPEALAASLARVVPLYLAARNQALMAEEAATQTSILDAPEPPPSAIVPAHPLERHVIAALCAGTVQFTDVLGYRKATPEERSAHPIRGLKDAELTFTWEAGRGLWTWIHVTAPADAKPTDVAQKLYGDAGLASEIVSSGGMFGFRPLKLTPEMSASWRGAVTAEATPASNAWRGVTIDLAERKRSVAGGSVFLIEPLAELRGGARDQAALGEAGALQASAANSQEIVQEMRLSAQLVDAAITDAAVFGMAARLAPMRAALEQRSLSLHRGADPAEALKWGAQAAAQRELLQRATQGIKIAADQWRAFAPAGKHPHSLPMHAIGPLNAVAEAYVTAAANADLVVTAREQLAAAELLSKTYPIDMFEAILASLRPMLAAAAGDKTGLGYGGPAYGVGDLERREALIRAELLQARDLLRTDPKQVADLLKKIQAEVTDLQDEVTVVANLDTIDAIWKEMLDHFSILGELTGKNADYEAQMTALLGWKRRWSVVRQLLASRNPEGKQELKKLRDDSAAFHELLKKSAALFQDEEKFEAYLSLGLKLAAMVGIAVVTMGVGEFVLGGLVGIGWGEAAFATTAVVGGAEALTFTTLTLPLLQENPSVGGFFLDLMKNWVTFGVLRGMSIGYEAMVGAKAAKTLGGQATLLLAQFEAMATLSLAEAAAVKKAKGEELTRPEARDILLQSAAVMIGTVIAARCGKPFMQNLKLRGAAAFRARFRAVDAARDDALGLAEALVKSKKIDNAGEVVAKDAEAIKVEQKLLEELLLAAEKNELPPDVVAELKTLHAENAAVLLGNRRAAVMLKLESIGPDRFLAEPGQLKAATKELTELGDAVTEPVLDAVTGAPTVKVAPKDGGAPIHITEKLTSAKTTPDATGAAPKAETAGPEGPVIDAGKLTESQQATERWLTSGLSGDPRGQALLKKPGFAEWYAKWMSQPAPAIKQGETWKAVYPEGCPADIRADFDSIVKHSNLTLSQQASLNAAALKEAAPELTSLDPLSEPWKAHRPKLVERFGEPQIAQYEKTMGQMPGDPARAATDMRLGSLVTEAGLGQLRAAFPDCQIIVTGSATQTSKPIAKVTDMDVIIVAPRETRIEVRVAWEKRAKAMTLEAAQPLVNAGGPKQLEVDAKVMTPEEYFGWRSSAPAPGRTPFNEVRIDLPPGGASGGGGKPQRVFVLFRGTTYSFLAGRSRFTHDLGPGVYMTPDLELAVIYAQERRSQVQATEPGAPGIVTQVETTMAELGRVLDVMEPRLRAEWEAFESRMPLGDVVLRGGGAAEIYNAHFENWLRTKNMKLSEFDVIIAPEYRNGGSQVCVRDQKLADTLILRAEEYARAHDPVTPAYPEGARSGRKR